MNRISVVALSAIALTLVACPKKNAGGADAAAEAAAPVAVDTAAVVDSGPATPLTPTPGWKPAAKPTDAGAISDAAAMDAAAMGDGGKMAAADAAAPEQCCCKVAGKLSHVAQGECTTTLKGACVAKTECEAKSCCCDLAGTKSNKLQSECSAAKGSCVKKDLCPK